jgi:hypothetical protein
VANIVTVEANKLLDSSVAGAAYTPAAVRVDLALCTDATTPTATTAGTEVTNAGGSAYARVDTTGKWAAASSGSKATNAPISFTNMPGPIVIHAIELWDGGGTPVRRWFGNLGADKSVNSGDTVTFASGSIVITLS